MSGNQSIEDLFDELIQLESGPARKQFLALLGAKDRRLSAQLERLLEAHMQAGSFLAVGNDQHLDETRDANGPEPQRLVIGAYKLLQKIGEGGMGTVYMAEQTRPLTRRVAVKIIKPGMDTQSVIARFEAERQALAMMDHPNIAKVLDAGSTDNGRPYFVMELVKGVPITKFCDESKLAVRERLKLFMQVCHAVQHAHQKGIIHRDLKPSNVMVAKYDGHPVPKVIDFGVAKATNQRLTERTIFTEFGQIVGTLEYMSPEQAQFNQLDIDTRSDVYSLGVLLYELLTGETPFDGKRLRSSGFEEILRILREEEPPKPSSRISVPGESANHASKEVAMEATKLSKTIQGDLDWIVLKALAKERNRRYEGANDLAADVGRLLENKPVDARPPSLRYRLERTYKRNQAAVITSLFVGLAVAVCWCVAMYSLHQKFTTLKKYRTQTIKTTFEKAINGDQDFEAALAIAAASGVSQDWLNTLQATYLFHNGNNEKTIELLDDALRFNPENTAAWGLQAVALIDQGDFERQAKHVAAWERHHPRAGFEDIDNLCLAYATYHVQVDDAVSRLEFVLEVHPTWNMARAMYAAALAEQGECQ